MKKYYTPSHAIVLAISFGIALRLIRIDSLNFIPFLCQKIGQIFLNGLMMGVLPLIFCSLILGAAKMTLRGDASKMAPQVLSTFGVHSFFSGFLASMVFFIFSPTLYNPGAQTLSAISGASLSDLILKVFPRNIFKALADLDMIGLIVFFLFFGASLGQVAKKNNNSSSIDAVQTIFDAILEMIRTFMMTLPIGVFALVCDAILRFEPSTLHSLVTFFFMFCVTIALYLAIWSFFAKKLTGYSFFHILKISQSALISGFTTSSSAVSLPVALDVLESSFAVNPDLSRFLMPLGITVNMAGTTLFVSLASLYISATHGICLDWNLRGSLLLLSWLTCLGTAGIPSGCLVALMIVLTAIGIPSEAIGILIGIDRFLDMIRTTLNLLGNICCTLSIAHQEKNL